MNFIHLIDNSVKLIVLLPLTLLKFFIDCCVTSLLLRSTTDFQVKNQMVLHQTIDFSLELGWLTVGDWRSKDVT